MNELKEPTPIFSFDSSIIGERIEDWLRRGYFPGASLLIGRGEQILCEKHWGNYHAETVEFIASAGKWLAAATILAVVEEGRLTLEDSARQWLPDLSDAKGDATLRQMLAHTSGYPANPPPGAKADVCQTLQESVARLAPWPLESAPGTRWNYGGLALQVAGRMAEIATGDDWETLFQTRIARPLGMTHTRFTPVDKGVGHGPMLGGGARSTLRDYARFLSMISGGGVWQSRRVLSQVSIQTMEADNVKEASIPFDNFISATRSHVHRGIYGLGVWRELEDENGRAVLLSSPSWAGTYPWIDRRNDLYGVFLAHVAPNVALDEFNPMFACAKLPVLSAQSLKIKAK